MLKIIAFVLVLAVSAIGCSKDSDLEEPVEIPVNRQVVFSVYAAGDYSAPTFRQVETSLTLTAGVIRLQVAHSIRYNNNGQLSQTANFETLPSDQVRHLKKIVL